MPLIDNRIIKASFKDCSLEDRKLFANSTCIMPISVGQKVHEASKFLATIKLISASFKACTILIDDSIQRYTMMMVEPESSEKSLLEKAIFEGDQWLKRNLQYLNELKIPFNILRWDDWSTHSSFKRQLSIIEDLYKSNTNFREQVDDNIKEYLFRNVNNLENKIKYELAFDLCLRYLQEECAVMTLWCENNYEYEVYPTGRNKAMQATYEHLIRPIYPQLLKSVSLRFKKYGGIKYEVDASFNNTVQESFLTE